MIPPSPLVSCIMPTWNRRAFLPLSLGYFLKQDHAEKELLIIDDGEDSVADLIPDHPTIRYFRLSGKHSVGAKRNFACARAIGDLIAHWDDDDWHAPGRIRYQAGHLLQSGKDLCGLKRLFFLDPDARQAYQYTYPEEERPWLSGSSLCYRKEYWCQHPFPEIDVGEDGRFVWAGSPGQMLALPDSAIHVGIIHAGNVSPKRVRDSYWKLLPWDEVALLLGEDARHYPLADATPHLVNAKSPLAEAQPSTVHPTPLIHASVLPSKAPTKRIDPMHIARNEDLETIEFTAFNQAQNLPRMRRWELPFSLFHGRLGNADMVLDLTINPCGLQERLLKLYPHTRYRHWNPIQAGSFSLPAGFPDQAYDRVFCINTLEHLLSHQREELVDEAARKLKPGGLLILTSDYCFDSAWENPAFLSAGVMRADRQEIFNGWNKMDFTRWVELCKPNGLFPLGKNPAPPEEGDPGLYLQSGALSHACIGGVFSKGRKALVTASRKIVLSLLTWNTREVSLDSLMAYGREAEMLARLGHEPIICVCDNGSTDGTAEALQQAWQNLPFQGRLILNPENRGNSIARNQILDYMREQAADYILFIDGDIEVVPFSSIAMLRHMENFGRRLGCIGADSSGQSNNRQRTSPCFYSVDPERLESTNLVAWTQYGMFRREIFDEGIRFDETSPFNGAGWGFEDNDLAFQMEMKGFLNQRFYGMVYLHRDARSSVRIMRQKGIDPQSLYEKRKSYVIDKWAGVPRINEGPLHLVRAVKMSL